MRMWFNDKCINFRIVVKNKSGLCVKIFKDKRDYGSLKLTE